ncbi:hypothetical protein [Dyadobacter beijingensis]|nr:hypothetical protein [Dyadobacter beijingensis]
MTDFANFNRRQSYFRPYQTHLDVYARLKKVDLKAMATGKWSYKFKIFCFIPIILFQCECVGCNILIHLNMPLLRKLSATSWLDTRQLTFMLLISDASRDNEVLGAQTIKISQADSDTIRSACKSQRTFSSMQIEDLVDIIYQLEIGSIWQS